MKTTHQWKFFRAGGFDQVRLESGADLMALDQLDQKMWVALACPTTGLEFDSRTLASIDTDKDGRIRPPELIAATRWAGNCLKNPDDLLKGAAALPLTAINEATAEGKQLLSSARQILTNLGKGNATEITLEDTSDTAKIFAQTHFNGDGIVPVDSAGDDSVKAVLNDIIACLGGETDRSGKPGVNQAKLDLFFAEAQAFSDWWKKAESDRAILPLDGSTSSAAATVKNLKAKINDYFARCRLAAFDARAVNALNREEKEYLALAAKDLTIGSTEIASLPLATVSAGKALPLKDGLNPAWSEGIDRLRNDVVKPLLKDATSLSESEWSGLVGRFDAYENWISTKAGASVEKLGVERVRAILKGSSKEAISALIAKDKALEPEANAIGAVERLVRYHRDLYKLLKNFVSFRDFYGRKEKAIFQAGVLYLDQRSCDLCLPVADPARHALMAGLAGTYLAYCDCVRKATGEKQQIVAAFTAGDSDNLMVGRNGVFYDRKGQDWDATITKIIDNPISVRQAFWAPYKKFVRLVEEQIAKRAAAADASSTDKLSQAATNVARADVMAQQSKTPAEPRKFDVGVVAALGVAVGAIGGALASTATGLMRLSAWQIPLVIVGLVLLISLPSMVIAWLKLRKRNLGPILDANGWAVNARAKMTVAFGRWLTQIATLPPNAQRDLYDPFAEKKIAWKLWLILIILVLGAFSWWQGKLDRYLPNKARSTTVLGSNAPAFVPPSSGITNAVPVVPVNK